jgi:hypothetical protein
MLVADVDDRQSGDDLAVDAAQRDRETVRIDSVAQRVLAKMRRRMAWGKWAADEGVSLFPKKNVRR